MHMVNTQFILILSGGRIRIHSSIRDELRRFQTFQCNCQAPQVHCSPPDRSLSKQVQTVMIPAALKWCEWLAHSQVPPLLQLCQLLLSLSVSHPGVPAADTFKTCELQYWKDMGFIGTGPCSANTSWCSCRHLFCIWRLYGIGVKRTAISDVVSVPNPGLVCWGTQLPPVPEWIVDLLRTDPVVCLRPGDVRWRRVRIQ